MSENKIRVRFAPSPTGYLHVGGLRTALYNYLFAKQNNGEFILRIEDTDRNRFVEGAVENLLKTLEWVGLDYDEGPDKNEKYGPYYQSQRLNIYKEHADELIKKGKAYYAFDTPERLAQLREEQQSKNLQTKYDKHDLYLSKEEIEQNLKDGKPYVVRLNVPPNERVFIDDKIRGRVEFDTEIVDDQILIKSDGYPTYHLANVVDDHLMEISHVIRGEEWLSSTPKHALLYDFFEWERPVFAHLPLLLNPDRSKLSKRQGDVAVEDYRDKGYLKETLINFVALLGWNAGDDKEFYYLDELVEKFSLERVNKAGAVFDVEKLDWLNFEHLRKYPQEKILELLKKELQHSEYDESQIADDYLLNVIESMIERVSFVKEFITKCPYFYKAPGEYEESTVEKRWKDDSADNLIELIENYSKLENPTKEDYEKGLKNTAAKLDVGLGRIIHPLRLAISGVGHGPGVYDIVFIIGKNETIKRINKAIEKLG